MQNVKVEIYGANWCKPCQNTKKYLEDKGIEYTFYDIDNLEVKKDYQKRTGEYLSTVPQVFINDKYVGGFNEVKRYFDAP